MADTPMCLTTIKPELQINSFKKEMVAPIACSLPHFFEEGKNCILILSLQEGTVYLFTCFPFSSGKKNSKS